MLVKFWFRQLSSLKQVNFMKKHGILVGVRKKHDRDVYIYMFRNLFAEVIYKNDSASEDPEKVKLISGLKELNNHLEKEIKSTL